MADVFISYAREDKDFVRRLHEALAKENRETWVDWEGIPPRAEWLAEIKAAIDAAEGFVFVISPDSATSRVCAEELLYAVEHNKRIVPIVLREVETEAVAEPLAKLNWIFFRDDDRFEAAFELLLAALDTDLDWVRDHTRLLVRALEWKTLAKNTSYTLRGKDLVAAEAWLTRAPENEPKPTGLQTEYVLASRKATTLRQGITLGAIAFGVLVTVVLALVAYFQNRERQRQRQIAGARQLINQAEALRDLPGDRPESRDSLIESVHAASQALEIFHQLGMYSVEADVALRESLALLPFREAELDLGLGTLDAYAFDPTGRFLAVVHGRDQFLVWDTVSQTRIATWREPRHSMVSVKVVAISVDGKSLVALSYDARRDVNASTVTVWRILEGRPRHQFRRPGRLEKIRLSPSGGKVYLLGGGSALGWDNANGLELEPLLDERHIIYDLCFSPDGVYMAIAYRKRGTRERFIQILDATSGEEKGRWKPEKTVISLSWTAGRILVKAQKTAQLHEAISGRLLTSYRSNASDLALDPNGFLVAERLPNDTVLVKTGSDALPLFRLIHRTGLAGMAFRPDGESVVTLGAEDRIVRLWLLPSPAFAEIRHEDSITHASFQADGQVMITVSTNRQQWWTLPKNGEFKTPRETSAGKILETSPRRVRVSGWPLRSGETHRVDILNELGELVSSIGFSSPVLATAITGDGARLAVSTGTITRGGWELRLEIWDVNHSQRVVTSHFPSRLDDGQAGFLAFSPNDRFIVSKSETGFHFWDAGKLTHVATIYHAAPRNIAFQTIGNLVATTGGDKKIRIWQQVDGQEIARIEETVPVTELALSPEGRWLVTLAGGAARLWLLQPEDLLQHARARLLDPRP